MQNIYKRKLQAHEEERGDMESRLEDLPEQTWLFLKLFRDKPGDKGFLSKLHITHNPICMKFAPFAHVRAFLMFFTSYQRKEVAQREDFNSCKAE